MTETRSYPSVIKSSIDRSTVRHWSTLAVPSIHVIHAARLETVTVLCSDRILADDVIISLCPGYMAHQPYQSDQSCCSFRLHIAFAVYSKARDPTPRNLESGIRRLAFCASLHAHREAVTWCQASASTTATTARHPLFSVDPEQLFVV
jgi:hypothetical protein